MSIDSNFVGLTADVVAIILCNRGKAAFHVLLVNDTMAPGTRYSFFSVEGVKTCREAISLIIHTYATCFK